MQDGDAPNSVESEVHFRLSAQTGSDHAWIARPNGEIVWANCQACLYAGFDPESVTGIEWLDLIHPDDLDCFKASWNWAMAAAKPNQIDLRIRRADGVYRWFTVNAEPVKDEKGGIIRWQGTRTDIHERKLAELAIAQGRDRMWLLSQEMMVICDYNGVIKAMNPAGVEMLGWPEADIVGQKIFFFVHPDDWLKTETELAKLARGVKTLFFENRYRTFDGSYLNIDWTAVPDGTILFASGRDVTKEHEIAEALAVATSERDRIWNTMNDLMATANNEGFLIVFNPAWERLLGYNEAELKQRPFMADPAKLRDVLNNISKGIALKAFEEYLIHKDGSRSLISWSVEPNGDTFHIVGRDITEQRAAEEALRQSQKMEALGQLTGGIAHDFNNMLQGIIGSIGLAQLLNPKNDSDPDPFDKYLTNAIASANRAKALVHRMLAFSRRQPLDPRRVEANLLITSMNDMLDQNLGENIEVKLMLSFDLWPALCDPHQLENAILNLVINARDAMPQGGKLIIETSNTQLGRVTDEKRSIKPGKYICIAVSDTGVGMSKDTAGKAFEPFFTTKPIGKGTGLGLSMIYGFARQSEGHAAIYSELGVGTTVKLYLPRVQTGTEAKDVSAGQNQRSTLVQSDDGETILIVEDEADVRYMIVRLLTQLGYQTIEAHDGPSGLEVLLSKQKIDLLLTDIGLPGLNGRQLADAGMKFRSELKTLFMTGYAENATSAMGFLEPGMAMITKPFALEELSERVKMMLVGA